MMLTVKMANDTQIPRTRAMVDPHPKAPQILANSFLGAISIPSAANLVQKQGVRVYTGWCFPWLAFCSNLTYYQKASSDAN